MASLSVRKLDDNTLDKLRARAAQHGVSMEEEVRRIIRLAVSSPERLGDFAVGLFSVAYSGDELQLPPRESSEPMTWPVIPAIPRAEGRRSPWRE